MPKYEKNFLSNVIVRADFDTPIYSLTDEMPAKLGSVCTEYFPIGEPRTFYIQDIQFNKKRSSINSSSGKEWIFHSKDMNTKLTITFEHMTIEYLKYRSFQELFSNFKYILEGIFSFYKELQIKRLGLRYVNKVLLGGDDPLEWSGYLNEDLLSIFKIPPNKKKLARILNDLILNNDDYMLRFRYGVYNENFPAIITNKQFILDYDAYYTGNLNEQEIAELLPTFHDSIESLFEDSITEKLREILNDRTSSQIL